MDHQEASHFLAEPRLSPDEGYELREGKMFRDTRYYAEPFDAPGWRTRWVERMEGC